MVPRREGPTARVEMGGSLQEEGEPESVRNSLHSHTGWDGKDISCRLKDKKKMRSLGTCKLA